MSERYLVIEASQGEAEAIIHEYPTFDEADSMAGELAC